jgi:hypothetical protein
MKTKKILLAALGLTTFLPVIAQDNIQKDSVPDGKEVKNRNVMLNASADNQPRQINIGLPAEMSATIYENGSPVSWTWWPMLPYFYWASGPHYAKVGMSSLSENAITNGSINYVVDCWSRTGGDKFQGFADYTTNSHGLQRFDVDIAGPIAKGWSYNIGTYINHDRGNNHLADVDLQQNMKQFHASLTKTFNNDKGQMSLIYKYSSFTDRSDGNGPFYYNTDGSVDEFPGFTLGKDGYIPADQQIEYMDVVTGKKSRIPRKSTAMSQDVAYTLDYNFKPNLKLSFNSKYHYANVHYVGMALAGIGVADAYSGYTYAAAKGDHKVGDVFTGNYQTRYMQHDNGVERAWYNTAELKGKSLNGAHSWRLGANIWWMLPKVDNSVAMFTHTVEKDPVWLNFGGQQSFAWNVGGEYYDMNELKTAVYASDDWQVSNRLWLSGGIRLEYYKLGGRNAMAWGNTEGTEIAHPENMRAPGWTLKNATLTPQNHKFFLPAVAFNGRYTIAKGFGILFEGIYTRQAAGSPNFAGSNMPNSDAINTYFGTAGLFWNTPWMKLVSQFSYIKKNNYQRNVQFTNPNNPNEVATLPTTYAVQTTGWTTDIVLTPFKGFNFHGLLTLQSPKFKDFDLTATFSDGTKGEYSFSDNYTTGVSKCIIELDPSYMFGPFRVWASFRYQSKQYINRTNSLYFKGRWETFAGVDYRLNKHVSFALQLVNLFNQKGASGSIASADLVTETSQFNHYLMSGTYIRPFTVELATHINF